MSTNSSASTETTGSNTASQKNLRKRKKAEGRKKRTLKLQTDKEFAKVYFEAKSKRSIEKKSTFRKKKNRKK